MKTTRFLPLALLTAMLAACNADNTAQTVEGIKADVAKDIEADMNKAINEAKADLTDITVTLADGGKAKITAAGDLSIDGKPVTLSAEQRELSKKYYAATKQIAMQGLEIGKESAKLATQAIGSAIGGIISGKNEADIEKSVEAKAGNIKLVADKLCASALELQAIEKKLTSAVPQFKPEPMTVEQGKDGCSVHSADNINIDLGESEHTSETPPKP
ncbi:DUF2884 family protein [Arenimonas sp. GDDSR-1]|uniref:DUF2884 family protein n=1 Tax=Arenimonas sp. GDDSR-1 TaxID=2950125 RepID=UPI00260948F2|nr:DUF2884 family protein [Arenimonas sp. GDDSR-1]